MIPLLKASNILSVFLTVILIVIFLRFNERRMIFYPTKEIEFFPKEFGLDYEEVYFKTADNIEINGWVVTSKGAHYTILFCHGNAGNISHRIEKLRFFHELGCNIFIFDYRGYGRSKGRPSEKSLYLDIQAAYNYLLSRGISPGQIMGYGESLGGAVIIDLAYRNKLAGLITECTVSNAKDMVRIIYPFIPYWVFSTRWDSVSKIKSITIPKLIIHSINDEVVPYRFGRKLYDNAAQPKEFLQIHGSHNNGFFESEAILKEKITEFLKKLK